MRTITGNNDYAVFVDDQNNANAFFIAQGTAIVTNHDDLNTKPVESLSDGEALKELSKPEYNLVLDPLPEMGQPVEQGKMYDYNGQVVLCRQDHIRTEHDPETVPALFSFYREDTGDLDWIVNESVELGAVRTYNGIKYECIQAHMTLQGWEPDKTPSLWKVYQEAAPVGAWSSGVAYKIGDQVTYLGHTYECRQAHTSISTWHPDVVPALWLLIS